MHRFTNDQFGDKGVAVFGSAVSHGPYVSLTATDSILGKHATATLTPDMARQVASDLIAAADDAKRAQQGRRHDPAIA